MANQISYRECLSTSALFLACFFLVAQPAHKHTYTSRHTLCAHTCIRLNKNSTRIFMGNFMVSLCLKFVFMRFVFYINFYCMRSFIALHLRARALTPHITYTYLLFAAPNRRNLSWCRERKIHASDDSHGIVHTAHIDNDKLSADIELSDSLFTLAHVIWKLCSVSIQMSTEKKPRALNEFANFTDSLRFDCDLFFVFSRYIN